jgi:hypothetical protein
MCGRLGNAVLPCVGTPVSTSTESWGYLPFMQESLVTFMDMIQSTRKISCSLDNKEWSLEHLTWLMVLKGVIYIFKYEMLIHGLPGILTYHNLPDYWCPSSSSGKSLPSVWDTIVTTFSGCSHGDHQGYRFVDPWATIPHYAWPFRISYLAIYCSFWCPSTNKIPDPSQVNYLYRNLQNDDAYPCRPVFALQGSNWNLCGQDTWGSSLGKESHMFESILDW